MVKAYIEIMSERSAVLPFLENKNIHTIDTLILTHDDFWMISGGYDRLKEKVKIKKVIKDSKDKGEM